MILEALEYLTTPCPAWARSQGYLGEAIAIRHRARRCASAWRDHQNNTKQAILDASKQFGSGGKIVVLGAGLCLDVPLADLADEYREVILVDACRLRGVKLSDNVEYQCLDVHGSAVALQAGHTVMGRTSKPLAQFDDADIVVSVNLISQLPILPLRHAGIPQEDAARIMQDHVDDLRKLSCPSILIGDAKRRVYDWSGELVDNSDLALGLALPAPLNSWKWPVVPEGESRDGSRVETTVGVWYL